MQPITWADSYGVWHVRVSKNAVAPLIAARRALRDELMARESNVARSVWMHPERVSEMDTDDTLVYREGKAQDEVLNCGHLPTTVEIDSFATGVARDAQGNSMCYDCANAAIAESIGKHDEPVVLYVKENTLTTWTGEPMLFIHAQWTSGRRYSQYGWWSMRYVRAHDIHGNQWQGHGSDAHDSIVMRPAKS